jgi:hypothetical protein
MTTESETENDSLKKQFTQWACNYLVSQGYTLQNKLPETIQDTPWSYVLRFATCNGYIYLKHTPPLLALEVPITQFLHDKINASVPEIIGHNTNLHCFLMKDAGMPLREILKKKFDVSLFSRAIDQFTSIQLMAANYVNTFLGMEVPDWRLDKLPNLFKQLLLQKELLIFEGLLEKDISALEALLPKVSDLCKKLAYYSIKETIVQCDFHDNNILISNRGQDITFIDLGEIVISHPFFSLIGCLEQAKRHHALTDNSEVYRRLLDAGLKIYMTFESKNHLLEAFATVSKLWFVYEALAQYRLRLACDERRFLSFQRRGKLSSRLKEFIAVCLAND